jgi:hypothetical protein
MRRRGLSHKAMEGHGWRRTDPKPWRKLSATWKHRDGWRLEHCGHPTALHPWALYDPKGRMHCTGLAVVGPEHGRPVYGSAWDSLEDAAEYVTTLGEVAIESMDRETVNAPQLVRWGWGAGRGAGEGTGTPWRQP